jgi:hypothetical protein
VVLPGYFEKGGGIHHRHLFWTHRLAAKSTRVCPPYHGGGRKEGLASGLVSLLKLRRRMQLTVWRTTWHKIPNLPYPRAYSNPEMNGCVRSALELFSEAIVAGIPKDFVYYLGRILVTKQLLVFPKSSIPVTCGKYPSAISRIGVF